MHAFSTLAFLAFLVATVQASVYVTDPVQSTTCTGGQSCLVQWIDNGQSPLLSAIGEATVSLYTGEFVQVQSLPSVDVSSTSSFTFVPNPSVGPNGQYYIVFSASAINYMGFSGSFTLDGMSGTTTPTGGWSTTAPTTTSAGSSTSVGSSTPGTSPTGTPTASVPSGTSTPVVSTTTPTGSTSAVDTTTASGTPSASPTLTTPTLSTPSTSPTTSPTTTTTHTTTSVSSSTASATPTNAAGRVGSTVSLGGIAALFVLSGVLAF